MEWTERANTHTHTHTTLHTYTTLHVLMETLQHDYTVDSPSLSYELSRVAEEDI